MDRRVRRHSRHSGPETQLSLPIGREPSFARDLFVVSGCNQDAATVLDSWKGGTIALVGPEGVGKTHLAHAWAARTGARFVSVEPIDIADLPDGPVVLEVAISNRTMQPCFTC